jgi:hypothetical protein
MFGYAGVLGVLISVFLLLLLTRSNVDATLLRAPGELFETLPDGRIENLYTIQLVNKTSRPVPVQIELKNSPGKLSVMGNPNLVVPKESMAQTSILIELPAGELAGGKRKLEVGIFSNGRLLQNLKTTFIGPRNR